MKKTLLYLILPMLFAASYGYSQTTIWDFGNSTSSINGAAAVPSWPLTAGIGSTEMVVDKLGLFPITTNTNFGAVTASAASFTDGYTAVNRFQLNGGGGGTAGNLLPTQRYVYFTVNGACTVKVWFKTGSNGSARTVMCTNGTTLLGSGTSIGGATPVDLVIFTANISAAQAAVGKIYIYGDTTSSNIYKIEVSGATVTTPTLANKSFQKELDITVYSKQNKIFLSNIKSKTQVNVCNVLGALVKSAQLDADSSLDINSGVYIVNAKSAEAEKSVKLIVQ
ncbi:T9SS type A sorting domain-containing protein [Flavobacterium nackdongense]|uniref:T9SS type A sorting domain-containing protein n=1 Tax=Flavobacterium nackdongense TaxID=2547394 RepID=A0A4P6YBF4_9FLAO|nr:T9SS type A sorting domain-containing protein [Flavobacterium nackdongense]QBN19518.1 T9SS type A sorting domain-containing protein [Flavobacterium nackdongense]